MWNTSMLRRALGWGTLAIAVTTISSEARGAATSRVSFELRPVKDKYLVGEPAVMILKQRGSAQMYNEGWEDLSRSDSHFRILINRGQGFTRFRRKRLTSTTGWGEMKVQFEEGPRDEYVLSYDDSIGDWMFPSPGSVQLVVEYEDKDLGLIRSNVVTLEIKAPEGAEREVYDALRSAPDRGTSFYLELNVNESGPVLTENWARRLIERYPRSVYLQGARIRNLGDRLSDVTDQIDPDDPMSPPAKDRQVRQRLIRERRAQFLAEAEALAADLEGGQFEPDALLTLASLYFAVGDEGRSEATYARVARDFPDRWAGFQAREEIEDDVAPELQVNASPSSLWPPSHKLESITVAVTVTDNIDPSPSVKLVSIACDDACNPAEDIAGATLNTDDRTFELRSERTGAGIGRTYTITYSAQDAAGNKAKATTKVTVAHDQGKNQ